EILEVRGERPEKDHGSLAYIKADERSLMTFGLSEISLRRVASYEISIPISSIKDVRVVEPAKGASRKGFYQPSHSP
nr:hypothetical protein [Tanacetum cinerariifolium]